MVRAKGLYLFKPATLIAALLTCSPTLFAAHQIDLAHVNSLAAVTEKASFREVRRDLNPRSHTLHVRLQQEYQGYKVWGGDVVLHVPNGDKMKKMAFQSLMTKQARMNGVIYHSLQNDLQGAPAVIFTKAQADKALATAVELYTKKMGMLPLLSQQESKLLVFVDDDKKAHFAFKVSFFAEPTADGKTPEIPTYLLDAKTFNVYQEWNDIHTALDGDAGLELVEGGGFGGNVKIGQLTYDGLPSNLDSFTVSRDAVSNKCYLQNQFIRVKGSRSVNPNNVVTSYPCVSPSAKHNNVYWNDALDSITGYSPSNDAMHNVEVVRQMFSNWYHMPIIVKDGKPAFLSVYTHYRMINAFYTGGVLSLGDGLSPFYTPFSTLDIVAHELSHGFTDQYSQLTFVGQSGGINESFGDMTAKMAELYLTGKHSWDFAASIVIPKGEALRYFDKPSRDCVGKVRHVGCSPDKASEYKKGMDSHQAAGVFNRLYYLWATSPGWDLKRVYSVMLEANMHYWTSNSTYQQASCGLLQATAELGYSTEEPLQAMKQLGIDTSSCAS